MRLSFAALLALSIRPTKLSGLLVLPTKKRSSRSTSEYSIEDLQQYCTKFDISIVRKKDAEESRQARRPPGPGKPCAVFECKFYDKNLGIELGRDFVGLRSDFTSVPLARMVTNSDSESVALFLKKNNRPKLSKRIEPSNQNMEDEFIYAMADELRNSL